MLGSRQPVPWERGQPLPHPDSGSAQAWGQGRGRLCAGPPFSSSQALSIPSLLVGAAPPANPPLNMVWTRFPPLDPDLSFPRRASRESHTGQQTTPCQAGPAPTWLCPVSPSMPACKESDAKGPQPLTVFRILGWGWLRAPFASWEPAWSKQVPGGPSLDQG